MFEVDRGFATAVVILIAAIVFTGWSIRNSIRRARWDKNLRERKEKEGKR
jgi:hypothetical protein